MRPFLLLALLLLPVLALADGMALGKAIFSLQETDQVAVVRLEPGGATVDMYIAIDGLPAGETVTYILPFWHKPEGFVLEEMEGRTFEERFITKARTQVRTQNEEANATLKSVFLFAPLIGAACAGLWGYLPVILASILFPTFGGSGGIAPYAEHSTPVAKAELYRVQETDLPMLVSKAGLPEKYTQVLKRYKTKYFAVMRLTGQSAPKTAVTKGAVRGVHYHFRHPIAGTESYTYTYPLGTGGGWVKPIVLTDVYVTCPDGWFLSAKAPTHGELLSGWSYSRMTRTAYRLLQQLRDEDDAVKAQTGTLLIHTPRHPTAWHRSYLMTNPTQDIVVQLKRHPRFGVVRVARAVAPYLPSFVLINFGLAWWSALHIYLRRRWHAGERLPPFKAQVKAVLDFATTDGVYVFVVWLMLIVMGLVSLSAYSSEFPLPPLIGSGLLACFLGMKLKDVRKPLTTDAIDTVHLTAWVALGSYALLTGILGLCAWGMDWMIGL
jgi:hypothetical protein